MNPLTLINGDLIAVLACPVDHSVLTFNEVELVCENGHFFRLEQGVPIFSENPRRELVPQNMKACQYSGAQSSIDPFVNDWLVNTNGNLYWAARGRLPRYPIPDWPFGEGDGKLLVDVGCSWGRWSIAAARKGYRPIGLDVHIDALAAGERVSRQLGNQVLYLCGDADRLPFKSKSIDLVFSYSVLQHLERSLVIRFFKEVCRVLKPGGLCFVQLPNKFGLYSMVQQAKRGFREARIGSFEMRYWSIASIRRTIKKAGLRNRLIRADGFFTQNPQFSDLDLLSYHGKLVVLASKVGCEAAKLLPILTRLADSLWVEVQAPGRS